MIKNITIIAGLVLAMLSSSAVFAAKYKVITVNDGGSISGKVSFEGTVPKAVRYKITKDNDVCGTGTREIDYVKVKDGALTDVIVYITKIKQGKAFNEAEKEGKIIQEGCEFIPYIQVMRNNEIAAITNNDSVLHNIHSYEIIGKAKKTQMNVSQPDKGTINKKVKLKRGVAMKIECDAHDFMHGFVFVAKNPYYASVAVDGTYTIDNVPAGKYKVYAFHGKLGTKKGKTKVAAGGTSTVDFTFKGK